ncbi:isochorismatase family protein [Bradyrhizobium sp. Arg237L]|uniref:isochorismatase family protein n=1 Tax=Bradyrhizobium sp. Arg237L TaxID=3003352 RepID=UPI00249E132B|nr:isochorismatase family protein [Bradyrhizobium sp. Arg237L]MDI4236490.1 isochorismatase family protein [Bradyrhizobium sp. Arg237L]
MLTIDPERSLLLIVDFQSRLMPAIYEGAAAIKNASRLVEAAKLIGVPRLFTEQNAKGLGATVDELPVEQDRLVHKQFFDACRENGFLARVPPDAQLVVAGCESHVCVQQTVLGLLQTSRKTYVVRDALGSRRPEDKETAIRRMERHGAEVVTTEIVIFEWLQTAQHRNFRDAIGLIK